MYRLWTALAAVWLGCSAAGAATLEEQRQTFVAAEQALEAGEHDRFAELKTKLADYPLYPYLLYQELADGLSTADAKAVRAFLKTWADTPLAWQLRRRWLTQLAERDRWRDYLADYRPTNDITLQCHRLTALIRTGQADKALPAAEALWLHGDSRPAACDPAFARWQQAGNPSPALAWKRIDLAMRAGNLQLAGYLKRFLPAGERAWADHWMHLYRHPERLADLKAPGASHPYLRHMQAHVLGRLAAVDPLAALAQWQAWAGKLKFTPADRRRVTWRLAVNLFDEPGDAAAAFFAKLKPRSGDTRLHELRLRAALQRGDWQGYLARLADLPPALRDTASARYWQARALEQTGRKPEAVAVYRELAEDRGYHGFLAADRLGLPYHLEHSSAPADADALAALAHRPGLQRSHELFALDRRMDARREWRGATADLDQARLIGAAKLAETWGWHDQAILTIAQGRYWDDLELRFPLAYRDTVEAQAQRQALDPAWIYAVVRQESAFMFDAQSRVGATGLMQLMPATARHVARRLPEHIRVNSSQLRRPELNITLGSAYLREMFDGLYDNRVLATAAYNAGPDRVRSWLPDRPMAADLWVALVPYGETRKYLQRVLAYMVIYQSRLGREPVRLSDQMPPIQPEQGYAQALAAKATSS